MSGREHFSRAARLALEISNLAELGNDIERLADGIQAIVDEASLPSYFDKVAREWRERRALSLPAKRRRAPGPLASDLHPSGFS